MLTTHYLALALDEAKKARGKCAPNPAVGAAVVKNNHVISLGYHRGPGTAHAEVDALTKAGAEAQGASLYVTLEPCCHWGKTPPCTEAIREARISQVYYGFVDPNPVVAGKGIEELRKHAIACHGVSTPEIEAFYQSYAWWWKTKRPFVTAKLALSLDGKIALRDGTPVTLTGSEARQFTHEQRKLSDAILTSSRTIRLDNPYLNVRLNGMEEKKRIYVWDPNARTLPSARIYSTASEVRILGQSNVTQAINQIGSDGCHDLWVETGGLLFSILMQENCINRAHLYVAPRWIGELGLSAFVDEKFLSRCLENAKSIQWNSLGRDGMCTLNW